MYEAKSWPPPAMVVTHVGMGNEPIERRRKNYRLNSPFEHRPVFRVPSKWTNSKVAQFRYDSASNNWTLYCSDRNGRWHRYTRKRPTEDISKLLLEVDRDPTGIFWG